MFDDVIYDCPIANCRTPIFTGKCREDCIKKYNKEIGIKPQTNGDRIRAMSDEEIAEFFGKATLCERLPIEKCSEHDACPGCWFAWLKEPYKKGEQND